MKTIKTPEQTQKIEDLLLLHDESKSIHIWIKSQSISHLKDFAQFLQMSLNSMLQIELDIDARFKILELFHPSIEYISETLGNYYLNPTIEPTDKNVVMIKRVQELEMAMVNNYLAVVKKLIQKSPNHSDRETLGSAIYHSMTHLSRVLIRSYEFYSPTYPEAWYCLHQLYQYAESSDLKQFRLQIENIENKSRNSIEQIYLETLLLATSTPFELERKDFQLILNELPRWSSYAILNSNQQENGGFILYIDKDMPPFRQEFIRTNEIGERYRFLDITLVRRHLNDLLIEVKKDKPIPNYLLEHLLQGWGKAMSRRYPRVNMRGNLHMINGISALHHFVSSKNENNTEKKPLKSNYVAHLWQIVDISANGYCLKIPFDPKIEIHAGGLIGLQEEDEPVSNRWGIGTVRWVKHGVDDTLNVGVQLLSPSGIPIQFQIKKGQKGQKNTQAELPGFLLPILSKLHQDKMLLLPVLPYAKEDILHIKTDTQACDIRLAELVNRSSSFMQYRFKEA